MFAEKENEKKKGRREGEKCTLQRSYSSKGCQVLKENKTLFFLFHAFEEIIRQKRDGISWNYHTHWPVLGI